MNRQFWEDVSNQWVGNVFGYRIFDACELVGDPDRQAVLIMQLVDGQVWTVIGYQRSVTTFDQSLGGGSNPDN